MDRETLVSAFATLWSDMAKMRDVAEQHQNLKADAQLRMDYIIDAIFASADDVDYASLDKIMHEACELSGLPIDHIVVRTVECELARLAAERKAEVMRAQAEMN